MWCHHGIGTFTERAVNTSLYKYELDGNACIKNQKESLTLAEEETGVVEHTAFDDYFYCKTDTQTDTHTAANEDLNIMCLASILTLHDSQNKVWCIQYWITTRFLRQWQNTTIVHMIILLAFLFAIPIKYLWNLLDNLWLQNHICHYPDNLSTYVLSCFDRKKYSENIVYGRHHFLPLTHYKKGQKRWNVKLKLLWLAVCRRMCNGRTEVKPHVKYYFVEVLELANMKDTLKNYIYSENFTKGCNHYCEPFLRTNTPEILHVLPGIDNDFISPGTW